MGSIFTVALGSDILILRGGIDKNQYANAYIFDTFMNKCSKTSVSNPFGFFSNFATNQIAEYEKDKVVCLVYNRKNNKRSLITYEKGAKEITVLVNNVTPIKKKKAL